MIIDRVRSILLETHGRGPIFLAAVVLVAGILAQGGGVATAGTFDNTGKASPVGPWGPAFHNLRIYISLPKSTVKAGGPILVDVKIEDFGPPLIIVRTDAPFEYKADFAPLQAGDRGAVRLKGLRHSFAVWQQFASFYTGTIYSTTVDLWEIYDVSAGSYKLTLESTIMPGSVTAEPAIGPAITTLISNTVQLTIVK
jgi:hypothetical protein